MEAITSALTAVAGFTFSWAPYILGVGAAGIGALKVSKRVQYIGENEQLLVKQLTKKVVINGPAVHFPSYISTLSYKKRKGISLNNIEYVKIQDEASGKVKIVKGPQNYLLSPLEEVKDGPHSAYVLSSTEYLKIKDTSNGVLRTIKGPCTFFPEPFDQIISKEEAIALSKAQFIKVENTLTGAISVEKGEQLLFLDSHSRQIGTVKVAFSMKSNQYVRLKDSLTGKIRTEKGPGIIFPGPHEDSVDGRVLAAIDLKAWEYVVIQDKVTGEVTVHRGQKQVWLGPLDEVVGKEKQTAITVDTDHAVLVQDRNTGRQRIITDPQQYIPDHDVMIVGVRNIIRLADNEAMILKDESGKYHFRFGDPEKGTERAFFLPPYWEVVSLKWSRGRRREKRDLAITRFDIRPQYMSFEFNCRTADNVEMILEGTFFWEVNDIEKMLRFTGDAPGDVCSHARSCFIELISKVTLAEFMDTFNQIAARAHSEDDSFYATRGIKIHSLEVTRYECADQRTSEILEQIIMETTNRMNRLSCQESENEVALAQLKGALEHEKQRTEVLKIQHEHALEAARNEGRAEAEKCMAFYKRIAESEDLSDMNGSMELASTLWQTNKKTESIKAVSSGTAQVYFTPQDANLTIHS